MAFSKKILICSLIMLVLSLIIGLFPVHGEEKIYDSVVRLHILANSDSEEDQSLKLKVRDEVLKAASPIVKDCKSQAEAIERLEGSLDIIAEAAEKEISRQGYDYSVGIELGEEHYPTRNYESCAFPAGDYVSLRIFIGEGEGKNWWCCLFPPLCLSAASAEADIDNEEAFIAVGLTDEQYKLITESDKPKYKVRFKILETIKSLFD